jgi:hypothetical protein
LSSQHSEDFDSTDAIIDALLLGADGDFQNGTKDPTNYLTSVI